MGASTDALLVAYGRQPVLDGSTLAELDATLGHLRATALSCVFEEEKSRWCGAGCAGLTPPGRVECQIAFILTIRSGAKAEGALGPVLFAHPTQAASCRASVPKEPPPARSAERPRSWKSRSSRTSRTSSDPPDAPASPGYRRAHRAAPSSVHWPDRVNPR